jgi:hypothetical protein
VKRILRLLQAVQDSAEYSTTGEIKGLSADPMSSGAGVKNGVNLGQSNTFAQTGDIQREKADIEL